MRCYILCLIYKNVFLDSWEQNSGDGIQVFRKVNSSQTNAYLHHSKYSYSGLIPNERVLNCVPPVHEWYSREGQKQVDTSQVFISKQTRYAAKTLCKWRQPVGAHCLNRKTKRCAKMNFPWASVSLLCHSQVAYLIPFLDLRNSLDVNQPL